MGDVNKFRAKDLIAAPFTPLNDDGGSPMADCISKWISQCKTVVIKTSPSGAEGLTTNVRDYTLDRVYKEINYPFIEQYADFMVNTHFTGIFVNGTLAEGISMTMEERKKIAETWVAASKGRLQVIVHVGANCIRDSQELSRHAESIGVDAIAALSPSFLKPENEEVLVESMAMIAGEAPKTPFYYYDINFISGVYVNVRKFMELGKKKIPTLCGLKHSSRELPNAHNCTFLEETQVLNGTDVQYLSCLALGMPGAVVASYLGNLFYDMKKAFDTGDMETARKLQVTAQTINNIRGKYGGGINVAKSLFSILTGYDVGPVRLPLIRMKSEQKENMKKDFVAAKLIDFAKVREE